MLAWALLLNLMAGSSRNQRSPAVCSSLAIPRRTSPFVVRQQHGRPVQRLFQQSDGNDAIPDEHEETLLCVHLKVQPDVSFDDAMTCVSNFCQSFPFAAVLPVQPLQYLPLDERGVEVKFLRKKTDIKSGVDGGIRFHVTTTSPASSTVSAGVPDVASVTSADETTQDDEEEEDLLEEEVGDSSPTIEIKAKRNSKGQVISKLMSEKLIVTKFVAELQKQQLTVTSNDDEMSLQEAVSLTSVFHKWM